MKSKIAGVAMAAVMACGLGGVSRASAAYIVDFEEVGGQVVATGSGTLDLSGLSFERNYGSTPGFVLPDEARLNIVPPFETLSYYSGVVGPASFGPGDQAVEVSEYGSSPFLLGGRSGLIGLPIGFLGGELDGVQGVFDVRSIYQLGLLPNTSFVYRLGSASDADTLTISVGPSMGVFVPLPSSAPLFGAAILTLSGIGYMSHQGKTKAA